MEKVTVDEFIRHYWDVSINQQALTKLVDSPEEFRISIKLDTYSLFSIPVDAVKDQLENYLKLEIEKNRQIINRFSEENPEAYNAIINGKSINNWTSPTEPETTTTV